MSTPIYTPLPGIVLALEDVPDQVFSHHLVGNGLALLPQYSPSSPQAMTACAPVSGIVEYIAPPAYIISTPEGKSILVHLGLETVSLRGRGFTTHVRLGQSVQRGQAIMTWKPHEVEEHGMAPLVPVIMLQESPDNLTLATPGTTVQPGDRLAYIK